MKTIGTIAVSLVLFGLVALALWRWPINGIGTFPWIASMFAINIIRAPFAKRNAANVVVEKKAVTTERALLALVALGASFIPLIHLATGLLAFANYQLPLWTVIAGALMLLPGLWLFWRSHADLGQNWSVTTELHEEQTLVTQGIYRRIRHPMYSAIWLLFLAQPLLVQNWIAGFAGPVAFGVMYFVRVPYEEAMMREKFGADYQAYMQRSGRLVPW